MSIPSPLFPGRGPSRSPTPLTEARPLHTSEIGSLKKLADHGTEWLGSSSGVYFVNTVRRAFNATVSGADANSSTAAGIGEQNFPAAEDILAGRDEREGQLNSSNLDVSTSSTTVSGSTTEEFESLLYRALGELPTRKVGMELSMIFFQAWHPLFPFLHGPTFLSDMETLYSKAQEAKSERMRNGQARPYDVRKLITFQLVINIAALDRPGLLPVSARIKSTADVSRVAGILAASHTIPTIQTLLAAELYLVSTIALRAASTVAGMVLRSIFQTGLHRCPLRYAQLSPEDCELRKRIFWSAYALDRHLSQSLGDPITLQDSDIDVCLSGRELHSAVPVASSGPMLNPKVITMHLPTSTSSASSETGTHARELSAEDEEKRRREAALTAYVQYSRLTGRVIEIFHKSIHARFPKREAIVYLTSDIETWWNELPDFLSGSPGEDAHGNGSTPTSQQSLVPFFSILYQQLLLLLNRPALSLDPTSAEFQHGLQVCIKASRTTLSSLKSHQSRSQTIFLPGLLSANWMAGLIVAFACLLGKYQKARACADIKTCLELLRAMNSRYNTAKQCYLVLSSLLADIRQRKASSTGYLALYRLDKGTPESPRRESVEPAQKRRRTNANANTEHSGSEKSPPALNGDRCAMRHRPGMDSNPSPAAVPASLLQQQRRQQASSFALDTSDADNMAANWSTAQLSSAYPSFSPAYTSSDFGGVPDYSFSSMPGMPDTMPTLLDGNIDMSVFGGMNFNMADVFESATWENLIGSSASAIPMPGWDGDGDGDGNGNGNGQMGNG